MKDVTLTTFLGNELIKSNLGATINSGKLSHAYIIEGQKGSGRHKLADILAAGYNCTNEEKKPCGVCRDCKKIANSAHPDIAYINLLDDKKTIGTDQIKDIVKNIYIAPNEAAKKVYIFNCAENLTPQAQNTLLKVLEEPPPFVAFILILEEGTRLLNTIYSRCVHLPLSAISEKDIMDKGTYEKQCTLCENFFEHLFKKQELDFLLQCDIFSTKEKYASFLEVLYLYLRDIYAFKASNNEELLYFFDRVLKISEFSDKITYKQIIKLMEFTKDTINAMEQNCNLNLWANSFFVKCWEEVH